MCFIHPRYSSNNIYHVHRQQLDTAGKSRRQKIGVALHAIPCRQNQILLLYFVHTAAVFVYSVFCTNFFVLLCAGMWFVVDLLIPLYFTEDKRVAFSFFVVATNRPHE